MSPCHHPSTRTTVPDWANWLSHCSGHSWETSGLCGELVDRVAVSMGEVAAHAGLLGWVEPRAASSELGGPPWTHFLDDGGVGHRIAGTTPLLFWLLLKTVFSSGFLVPVSRDFMGSSAWQRPGRSPGGCHPSSWLGFYHVSLRCQQRGNETVGD